MDDRFVGSRKHSDVAVTAITRKASTTQTRAGCLPTAACASGAVVVLDPGDKF